MPRKSTKYIVLHTSATRAVQDIGAADIRKWHRAKGWSDIGYHYVIRRNGKVETGRKPDNSIGAHVQGHNSNTLGICLVGGLKTESPYVAEDNYTAAQWKALESLIRSLLKKYPNATICGHRDFSPDKNRDGKITSNEWIKICPCFDARTWAKSRGLPAAPAKL